MRSQYFLVAALAAPVFADTTEIQIFRAGTTDLPLTSVEASVLNVNAVATTLVLNCVQCDINLPITVTEGPSTYYMSAVYSTNTLGAAGTATVVEDCKITSSTKGAECAITVGIEASDQGYKYSTVTSSTTTIPQSEITYEPLTITAGAEKLTAPQATQTPSAVAAHDHVGLGGAAAAAVAAAAMGLL